MAKTSVFKSADSEGPATRNCSLSEPFGHLSTRAPARAADYDPAMKVAWSGSTVEARELGSGPAVVLLHGYPLDGAMWSGVARLLSESFRVVKPDLPGRGDTPAPAAPGIEGYADFIEAILAELIKLTRSAVREAA